MGQHNSKDGKVYHRNNNHHHSTTTQTTGEVIGRQDRLAQRTAQNTSSRRRATTYPEIENTNRKESVRPRKPVERSRSTVVPNGAGYDSYFEGHEPNSNRYKERHSTHTEQKIRRHYSNPTLHNENNQRNNVKTSNAIQLRSDVRRIKHKAERPKSLCITTTKAHFIPEDRIQHDRRRPMSMYVPEVESRPSSSHSHRSERPQRLSLPDVGQVVLKKNGKMRSVRKSPSITEKEFPVIKQYEFAKPQQVDYITTKANIKATPNFTSNYHNNNNGIEQNKVRHIKVPITPNQEKTTTHFFNNVEKHVTSKEKNPENKTRLSLAERVVEGREDPYMDRRSSFHGNQQPQLVTTYS